VVVCSTLASSLTPHRISTTCNHIVTLPISIVYIERHTHKKELIVNRRLKINSKKT
jgi:hypothetical protein